MKLKQNTLSCILLGVGLLGAGLCLYASRLGTDSRGLLFSNHPIYYLIYALSAGLLGFLFYALRNVKGMLPYSKLFQADPVSVLGYGAATVGIAFTALNIFKDPRTPLSLLTAISGILAALCMGAVGYFRYKRLRPHYSFHAVVTIHLVLFLIYRYQLWNTEPQLPLYFTQLMASLFLMLALYQRTAFDADMGARRDYTFFGLSAAFFCCLAAISDYAVFYLTMGAWCLTNQCSLQEARRLPPMRLPEEVLYCIETLMDAGHSAFVVGGCVRDHLLGLTPSDYDMCTSATPDEICDLFERHQLVRNGEKHGTIGVVVAGQVYEITTFRTEGSYSDTRHPDWVEFVTDINQDLARRDFTVNAIAYCPGKGYVDPFGGQKDLKTKVLRAVGEPETRFREDALRILRGVRFSTRFNLLPEEKTLDAMKNCAPLLDNIAKERISSELCKLLPQVSAKQLLQYKPILIQIIPALAAVEDTDIYSVTANVVGLLPPDLPLRMAALLHRLPKEEAESLLQELRCSNALRNRAVLLVQLQTPALTDDKKQLFHLLGEHGSEAVEQLLELQIAIAKTAGESTAALDAAKDALATIHQKGSCLTVKTLAVTGTDLLSLGVEPGPRIGQCMQFLLSLVQDDILQNTKEDLMEAAKNFFDTEEEI